MLYDHRIILFVQIYSIYNPIIEEQPSSIYHKFKDYLRYAGDVEDDKSIEPDKMKTYIINGKL